MPLTKSDCALSQESLADRRTPRESVASQETRIALVPRVTTQRWSGFGWEVMQGSVMLTNRRIVFIPDEIGANTSFIAVAGALGGIIGALATSMATKSPSRETRDLNRSLDEIVASSKMVLELRYEDLRLLECRPGGRLLQITVHRKNDGRMSRKTRFQLSMPDGFLTSRTSAGMDRKQAWEEYCTRCRTAFESSVLGRGVDIEWTK